jgi:PmbA protein
MEKLLARARARKAQAEIYRLDQDLDTVSFENGRLKDIVSSRQSGLSLRLLHDRKIGFTYTKNLTDRDELIDSAFASLRTGVEAHFDFPRTRDLPPLATYDPSIEGLSNTALVAEGQRICAALAGRTEAQINLYAFKLRQEQRVLNTAGTDLADRSSGYYLSVTLLLPGGYSGIHRGIVGKAFQPAPDKLLNFLVGLANPAFRETRPPAGKMKVLFMPEALFPLTARIRSGMNGKNVYQKESPVADKLGKKIFDAKLTIYDDPLNDEMPQAAAFDSEGTACRKLTLVENGVLKNFYYDLEYASRMKAQPTGHGNRSAAFGGDPITIKPNPSLDYLYIRPGDQSFEAMVRSMDQGIIIGGVLGAHSGNIPNGDFSIGLSPGLYVEHGEIRGRVNEAMIAGNIYDVLKHIVAIENTLYPAYSGTFPAILFDKLSIATRN